MTVDVQVSSEVDVQERCDDCQEDGDLKMEGKEKATKARRRWRSATRRHLMGLL